MATAHKSRKASIRKKNYKYYLPTDTPAPPAGIEYRWGRCAVHGQVDDQNMIKHMRNGWVPVKPEELNKSEFPMLTGSYRGESVVTANADLVLLKNTTERVAEETEYFADKTRSMEDEIERQHGFRSQMSDPRYGRMKVRNESRVQLGQQGVANSHANDEPDDDDEEIND